eukprot:TRINITY_DN3615_c0_g1_i2.p1 TRINITY_DN3615_c0_g1~~TRINITY_DN3615_c0_g1_i2.p1  ORF type:complete len:471 (-),score=142.83 TRINITY_DN3615_c0_g1_i2:65-1477(-)
MSNDPIKQMIASQLKFSTPVPQIDKIAIGYNTCLDLIVSAKEVFDLLYKDNENLKESNEFVQSIKSLDDLRSTFSYFFKKGVAAERFVEDKEVFLKIIEAAEKVKNKNYYIGGNAGLLAQTVAQMGSKVLLGGASAPKLRSLLHENIEFPYEDTKYKLDEIHLILEYQNGQTWGEMKAPRANRFIITHDLTNSMLLTVEDLHDKLEQFDPKLLIISGVHMLESSNDQYRLNRVEEITKKISDVNKKIPVHLELASIGSPKFIKDVAETIVPFVDSLGLNEDELGRLYVALGGSELAVEAFHKPSVVAVEKALYFVFSALHPFKSDPSHIYKRKINRIHFHCLEFHIIVVLNTNNDERFYSWKNNHANSVVSASRAVSLRACDKTELIPEEMELRHSLSFQTSNNQTVHIDPSHPVFDWSSSLNVDNANVHYYFTPVLVCKFPRKTVGCGDAVSSTGLVYSVGGQAPRDEL